MKLLRARSVSSTTLLPTPDIPDDGPSSRKETCTPFISIDSSELQEIDPYQLVRFMEMEANHDFSLFDKLVIVDGRFGYEFVAGHILGAVNINTWTDLLKLFHDHLGQRIFFVFHCEFSGERGPTLQGDFRRYDREYNRSRYPKLSFEHAFLLKGGFKEFFAQCQDQCTGKYLQMRDQEYCGLPLRRAKIKYNQLYKQPKDEFFRGHPLSNSKSQQTLTPVIHRLCTQRSNSVTSKSNPLFDIEVESLDLDDLSSSSQPIPPLPSFPFIPPKAYSPTPAPNLAFQSKGNVSNILGGKENHMPNQNATE